MGIYLKGYEPHRWSWTRQNAFVGRCMKQYELAKVMHAPERPSWYALGGNAVHAATEEIDRLEFLMGENVTAEDEIAELTIKYLDQYVAEAQEKSGQPDHTKWLGDRRTQKHYESWSRSTPEWVKNWVDWRKENHWEWAIFNGEPAIELRLEVELGGLPFTAIIDRVPILPNDSLAVLDLKSGKEPKSELQMGVYAVALEAAGYERPEFGMFWMAKKGEATEPIPLARYTKDYIDQICGEAIEGVRRGVFPPNPGEACGMCSVAEACFTNEGSQSHLYDRLDPNYQPQEEDKAA